MNGKRTGIIGLLMILLGMLALAALFFFLTRQESEPGEKIRLVQYTNTPTPEQGATHVIAQRTRVNAYQAWQVAVESVRTGDSVKIEYVEGTWAVWGGPGGVRHRADGAGYADERRPGSPLSTAPVGALIGRIGGDKPFYVGNGVELTASESGALAFQINDTMRGDNTGTLWLSVTVTHPGADAAPADVAPAITPPAQVPATKLARLGKPVNQVVFAPDGKILAVASSPGIHLYDAETLVEIHSIDTEAAVMSVAFSPDGQLLAAGLHPSGAVQLWRVGECESLSKCGTLLRTLEGHAHGVWSVAFAPDGQTLASGSLDKTVRLWQVGGCDLESEACGTLLHTLPGHSNGVISVAFAPDGQTLAVGAWDNATVWLWRVGAGQLLNTLQGGANRATSVAFAPDQQILAWGSQEGRVLLWQVAECASLSPGCDAPLRTLEGHLDVVYSVAFAPDGQTVASGALDNTVRLWRVSDGALLYTLDGEMTLVTSVAFSPVVRPDGQTLAAGSHDGTVQLWDLATQE